MTSLYTVWKIGTSLTVTVSVKFSIAENNSSGLSNVHLKKRRKYCCKFFVETVTSVKKLLPKENIRTF